MVFNVWIVYRILYNQITKHANHKIVYIAMEATGGV